MEIQLKLYGSSKILSDKDILNVQLPVNSNIEKLRDILTKIISEKNLKNNLKNLPKTAAFFSEKNEVVVSRTYTQNKVGCSGEAATRPPSTVRVCPVMNSASSEASHTTARAISVGCPKRPEG